MKEVILTLEETLMRNGVRLSFMFSARKFPDSTSHRVSKNLKSDSG